MTEPAPGTIEHRADADPDGVCIVDGERRLTWGEWDRRAARLANALVAEAGVRPGDRVAVHTRNRSEWFEIGFALNKIGATSVSVGFRLTPEEVRYIAEDASVGALLTDSPEVGADAPLEPLIVLDGHPGGLPYEELIEGGGGERRLATGGPSASTIVYTSGTTGRPKGAVREFTPDRMAALGETLADMLAKLRFGPGDVHLLCCPVYHAAPPFYAHFTLAGGGRVAIMDRFDPEEALRLIDRERVSTTFMVPTMINRIVSLPEEVRARYDVSSLKTVLSGGGPFPTALKLPAIACFGDDCLFDMYGSTETGNVTLLEPADQLRKPGSVGKPLAGVEVRVLDEQENDVPPGERGELYIRSPMLVSGYHGNADATAASMKEGFFTVGDVGYLDEEGFLYVVDRVKDMVISGGANVYPAEIEDVLRRHPGVFDVAVIGIPHDDLGEQALALVQPRPGESPPEEELRELCAEHLAKYKIPRRFELVDDLPRNPFGKVLKRALREPYWSQAGRGI